MDIEQIRNIILSKINTNNSRIAYFNKKFDYFNGKYDILNKKKYKIDKTNTKMVNNFAIPIVENATSYFLGQGIKFTTKNPQKDDILNEVITESNLKNNINKIARDSEIYGVSYLLAYYSEAGELKFVYLNPGNVILHKNFLGQSVYGITIMSQIDFETEEEILYITFYTKDKIYDFEMGEEENLKLIEERDNLFAPKIPIIEFGNDIDYKSALTNSIISKIEAYNLIQSNRIDANCDLRHSLLALSNVNTDPEFLATLKDANILLLKDKEEKKADAKYITKTAAGSEEESLLNRIKNDIFTEAKVPDFQNFDLTGRDTIIAIQAKLEPLCSKIKIKEEIFIYSFIYLFKIIEKYVQIKYGIEFSYREIQVIFNRTKFTNITEELANAKIMIDTGIYSTSTILDNVSIIKNSKEEIEKKKSETIENPEVITDIKKDYFTQ